MSNRWCPVLCPGLFSLAFLLASVCSVGAAEAVLLDVPDLARRIDGLLARNQQAQGVVPARCSDDAEYIRRVYLDLAGCIPSIIDVRDFLDDTRPNKRRLWVDLLLEGKKPGRKPDAYNHHFANVWRAWLLAHVGNQAAAQLGPQIENTLRERFKENMPYDRMVRELIAATANDNGMSGSGSVFFQANEFKPENVAASVSRLFLGIKLECAQCHDDRSGGNWSQTQFWSFAAFFSGIGPQRGQQASPGEIQVPGRNKVVRACFLDGSEPVLNAGTNPRTVLADWLTSPVNPYFARAAVNRIWTYLFGTGLTEPMDEQGDHNPPSHPELLDELARQFTAHQYDLKYLLRALVASQAYQRTSVSDHPGQDNPRLFARMAIRGLSAEQLFDSLAEATEYQDGALDAPSRFNGPMPLTPRQVFLSRFSHQDKSTEAPTSILQALYLMNSAFVAERTSLEQNRTLATIADAARTNTARRVETLFLVVLSRKPTAIEASRFIAYIEHSESNREARQALADVFWALLNSAEFRLNH
jgi:hypothetical protein